MVTLSAFPTLLVGGDWLPNVTGGLNRYFHGLAHAVAQECVGASAVVTFVRPGQTGPLPLRPMASENAGLLARLRGARLAVTEGVREGARLLNPHFALYAFQWVRETPRGSRLVVNFHGPWADEMLAERGDAAGRLRAAAARAIERSVYRRADSLIVLSQAFRDIAVARYGVPANRIWIVPGGLDLGPYVAVPLGARAELRARLGWPTDRPIVLSVRRLARRMGLENLIEAAAQMRARYPGLLVLIGGTGYLEGELARRIEQREVADTVRLLGFIPDSDLPAAYGAADLTVVPTLALEGFGLTTVESLAAGTLVVGTPIGGTPEILRGLSRDLIASDATPTSLAERILDVLDRAEQMPSPDDCRRYAEQFGWEAVWPSIRSIWGIA